MQSAAFVQGDRQPSDNPPSRRDALIDPYHDALGVIIRGEDPKKYKALYAHSDDVTLGNPFGPIARGWEKISETLERAATNYREGKIVGFENLAKCVTPELAYIVEVERTGRRSVEQRS